MPKQPQAKEKAEAPKKKTNSSSPKWHSFDYGPGALQSLNDMGWPWRSLKFKKAPKALRMQEGWTATAEFTFPFIPRTVIGTFQKPWGPVTVTKAEALQHQWEPLGISMSKRGWELWGKLNRQDRMEILEGLASWPVKNNFWEGGNKPRGSHDQLERTCTENSQWAGSCFLHWAKATPANDPLKARVVKRMKGDGLLRYTPYYLAAYLTRLSWEVGAPHMGAPSSWPLKNDPTVDPHEFFKTLFKNSPYQPKDPPRYMDEIKQMILNLFTEKEPTLHYPPDTFVPAPSGFPEPFTPRKPHRL